MLKGARCTFIHEASRQIVYDGACMQAREVLAAAMSGLWRGSTQANPWRSGSWKACPMIYIMLTRLGSTEMLVRAKC